MSITRRDILKLAGGSILGTFFTPVPWKVLDDSAIWTQNWSLIPQLQHGPITFRHSACTLCPGGCALKARCINGHPVSLAGTINQPISKGVLCPIGLAGHHLSYHPLRLSGPFEFAGKKGDSKLVPASLDKIVTELSKTLNAMKEGRTTGAIAVLDQRPGRAISTAYQEFLALFPRGYYILPPSTEASTLTTLEALSGNTVAPLGFDFEHTGTILSFGAPLLDGWGTPGRMADLFNNRKQTGLRLIQVESVQSRTALQSDVWLPVRPGTEAALALGIANVILSKGLYPTGAEKRLADFSEYRKTIAEFNPQAVSNSTGISTDTIIEVASAISASPSIIIAGCDPAGGPLGRDAEEAIAGLNCLCGNVGRAGGILVRQQLPFEPVATMPGYSLIDVPDHSIRVLILDSAESGYTFPSALLARKMVPEGGIIISLSPYLSARSALADYLIPAPAHLESLEEVATPPGSAFNSFSLSTPLIPGNGKSAEPIVFLGTLAHAIGLRGPDFPSLEPLLKQRADAIHRSGRGILFSPVDGSVSKVSDFKSPEEMWAAFMDGGCWVDNETPRNRDVKFTLPRAKSDVRIAALPYPKEGTPDMLTLMPTGWRSATTSATISPVLSKLFQESDLRNTSGQVFINPVTAASHGLTGGEPAALRTQYGTLEVLVQTDASIMPGIIRAAIGPSPNKSETTDHFNNEGVLAICEVDDAGSWRFTEATLTGTKD